MTIITKKTNKILQRSTIINTSKEMMCFTDFPIPEEYPPFMPHYKIIEYFQLYVKHFKLLDRIKFNTRVESISKAEDYEKTGRYVVMYFFFFFFLNFLFVLQNIPFFLNF